MAIPAPKTLPLKADFLALANAGGQRKPDRLPVPGRAVVPAGALPTILAVAPPEAVERVVLPAAPAASKADAQDRRTSWSLVALAYGFAALGIGINVWNAIGGNIADTALPAAMGVLAEGVVFFLPARLVALPAARRALGITLLLFVSAFALTNSLRMASIVAADTAAARADRTTEGTRSADAALDAARKARDDACGRGQGKTVACKTRVDEVGKLEAAKAAAVSRVADQARPESGDFAKLTAWLSRGTVQPGAQDFDMLWLLFRTFLPQIGGLVLMLARR